MALFSFGQTLKKKLSRSKRNFGENGKKCLSLSPSNQQFTFPNIKDENKAFDMRLQPLETSRSKECFCEDETGDEEENVSFEDMFMATSILKQRKRTERDRKRLCNVAVGPDFSMKMKEKSTQTKLDIRHRYTDTRDLNECNIPYSKRLDYEDGCQLDEELITKIWKEEWLNAINNKGNHFNLLKEIKRQNKSIKRSNSMRNNNEMKFKVEKYPKNENEESTKIHEEENIGFDLNFSLDGFPDLENNCTLMANYVTKKLYGKLKDVRTPKYQIGLGQIIQQGIINKKDERCIGITACDVESYEYFAELFTPIIQEIRPEYKIDQIMQKIDLNSVEEKFKSVGAIENDFIFEMRITMKRSLENVPFTCHCNKNERRIIQTVLADACQNIKGELEGNCWMIDRLSNEEKAILKDEEKKFNSKIKSINWKSAGITRNWPDGRAIFKGGEQDSLIIVINGEEHLTMCLSIYDGNLQNAMKLLLDVERQIEISIQKFGMKFAWNDKLGNLNTFIPHLGLGCCISARVLFPSLDGRIEQKGILQKFHLKSTRGITTKKQGYEISSFHQFGVNEVDLTEHMTKALNCMTQIEKRLQQGDEDFKDILRRYEL